MFSGMSFDADVSLEFMYESTKHIVLVSMIFPFGFEDANLEKLRNFN